MSEPFNPNYVRREPDTSSPPSPMETTPPRNKGGRPMGSKNKPKGPWKSPVAKIERTAGVTTYSPRVEVAEAPLPPRPEAPKIEKPTLKKVIRPERAPGAPRLQPSGGQFSLLRVVINNVYTQQKRSLSIPLNKRPEDYIDRGTEEVLEVFEASYWSEHQRDAELRAFKTLLDPLAANNSPHAQRPPQEATESLLNMTE